MSTAREVRLTEALRLLGRHRRALIAGLLLGLLIGVGAAVVRTPNYKSDALLSPVKHGVGGGLRGLANQLGGLASLAGVALGGGLDDDNSPVAMLQSHLVARTVIQENELIPELFHRNWDEAAKRWKSSDPDDVPTLWEAEQFFLKKVCRVAEDRRTGLVTVTIVWRDARLAAEWASKVVSTTDRLLRQRAMDTAKTNIAFLQEQLDKTNVVEVRQSVNQLLGEQMKELMLAQGGSEYAFKVLDPAIVAEKPVGPSSPVLIIAAALLGLLVSMGLVLLLATPRSS